MNPSIAHTHFEVTVFTYPLGDAQLESAVDKIRSLIRVIDSEYHVPAIIDVRNGNQWNRPLAEFLTRFLDAVRDTHRDLDVRWLCSLNAILGQPTPLTLEIIEGHQELVATPFDFLKPFLLEAKERCEELAPAASALFMAEDRLRLTPGQGVWGACYGDYPGAAAVETTNYAESIFHEFLHMFGVNEGYDEHTNTLPGCEDCWMQYEATKGSGLCSRHQNELRNFLARG